MQSKLFLSSIYFSDSHQGPQDVTRGVGVVPQGIFLIWVTKIGFHNLDAKKSNNLDAKNWGRFHPLSQAAFTATPFTPFAPHAPDGVTMVILWVIIGGTLFWGF